MPENPQNSDPDRRDVITTAAKIGLVIPPAMAFLMTTSMSSKAIAGSAHGGSSECEEDD